MDSGEPAVNPAMLVVARQTRGKSLSELANQTGISVASLSRMEAGLRAVTPSNLTTLANALEYPEPFFRQTDPIYGFGASELFHHRKRKDVPARVLDKVHAQLNVRRMHLSRLLRGLEIGEVNFPTFDAEDFRDGAVEVARAVRAYWKLPRGPIRNVVRVIEDARGIVIPFEFGTTRIDAISHWPPNMPPLFLINPASQGDRMRFTLCHELGHVVLHQQAPTPHMEEEADQFAAELLMPEREIRPYLTGLTLQKLASLKPYWKVSLAALLKRASDLGEVTPRQYRSMWERMGARGYRTREPAELDIPVEMPTLHQEIVDTYRQDLGYSVNDLGKMLNELEHHVRRTYFGAPLHLRPVSDPDERGHSARLG